MFKIAIFGAQSIALGICKAVRQIYREFEVIGFVVSSRTGNSGMLAGLPVYELEEFQDKKVCVLIAVPEDIQESIIRILEEDGFHNHICVDSETESALMEEYYAKMGMFQSLHRL